MSMKANHDSTRETAITTHNEHLHGFHLVENSGNFPDSIKCDLSNIDFTLRQTISAPFVLFLKNRFSLISDK